MQWCVPDVCIISCIMLGAKSGFVPILGFCRANLGYTCTVGPTYYNSSSPKSFRLPARIMSTCTIGMILGGTHCIYMYIVDLANVSDVC